MKDFHVFLNKRKYKIGVIKSTPENIWVSEDLSCQFCAHFTTTTPQLPPPAPPSLPSHPEHRVHHFCSFPLWTPFRECWSSAAAAAHDLILVEVDGKHPGQVPICSWQTWLRTIDQKTTSQRAVSNWGGPSTYEFFGWEIHVVRQEMTAHPKKHISQVNDFTVFLYIFCT